MKRCTRLCPASTIRSQNKYVAGTPYTTKIAVGAISRNERSHPENYIGHIKDTVCLLYYPHFEWSTWVLYNNNGSGDLYLEAG